MEDFTYILHGDSAGPIANIELSHGQWNNSVGYSEYMSWIQKLIFK